MIELRKRDQSKYLKEWYQKNKERKKAEQAARVAANPELYRERAQQWAMDNFEKALYKNVRNRAKKEGTEFSIDLEDVIIPEYCPYLGCKITRIRKQGRVATNASLDRIDSSKGYIKGNVQVICDLANRMKQNATEEQLIAFAKGVLKKHD